jgi:hypothetical protein
VVSRRRNVHAPEDGSRPQVRDPDFDTYNVVVSTKLKGSPRSA